MTFMYASIRANWPALCQAVKAHAESESLKLSMLDPGREHEFPSWVDKAIVAELRKVKDLGSDSPLLDLTAVALDEPRTEVDEWQYVLIFRMRDSCHLREWAKLGAEGIRKVGELKTLYANRRGLKTGAAALDYAEAELVRRGLKGKRG